MTTVPYTFATQGGDVPAAELDANFQAVLDAANASNFSIVATIAALRTYTGANTLVYVTSYATAGDEGGGFFLYLAADTTSPDDGAVIIKDSSNRRWQRQWSGWFDFRWAGAVADGTGTSGGTDNGLAMLRITYQARKASALGTGFNWYAPPGQYNYSMATCGVYWLAGIKKLVMSGYGSIWQNTYSGGDGNLQRTWALTTNTLTNTSGATYLGVIAGNDLSWLINNTAPGDTSITLSSPANAAAWVAGDSILITSVDLEYLGYPSNPGQVEYHTVVSVNTSTGVVVLDTPVQFEHLTTYPDGADDHPCGRGRAWKVSSTQAANNYIINPLNPPAQMSLYMPFEIDHQYLGLTINQSAVAFTTYQAVTGKRTVFKDCTLIGISPTTAQVAVFEDCRFTDMSEPDKLVERVVLRRCFSAYGVGFQSSSITYLDVEGGHYASLGPGMVKYVNLLNVNMDQMVLGGIYGQNLGLNIIGGSVRSLTTASPDIFPNSSNVIDASQVTYSNGVISMSKLYTNRVYWGLQKGAQLNLCQSGGAFSGDTGTGVVTAITEDSPGTSTGSIHYTTTWPWATLPAWAGSAPNQVKVGHQGTIFAQGVGGCDTIRNLCESSARRLKPSEFYRAQLLNFVAASWQFDQIAGALTSVTVDVKQVSSVSGAALQVYGFFVKDDTFDDQKELVITIDLTVRGKRTFSLSGFSGLVGADAATFNSVTITALPAGRWLNGLMFASNNLTLPGTLGQVPIVSLDMQTSIGMFGDTLIHNTDRLTDAITNVTGLVPA